MVPAAVGTQLATPYNALVVEEGLRFGGSADDKLWRSDQAWWGYDGELAKQDFFGNRDQ